MVWGAHPGAWREACTRCVVLDLSARTVGILAEAYELCTDEVEEDVAVLQRHPRSGVELLEWVRRRHRWHASTGVYYLAALRRALSGMRPWV
jgi:hypothetical protein